MAQLPIILDRSTNARAVYEVTFDSNGNTVVAGSSGSPSYVTSANYTPKGYQQITNATLAAVTALTVPSGSRVALIQNNGTQPVRFKDDNGLAGATAVSATSGQRIINGTGDFFTYDGDLSALRFIREADGAILDITYYA